MCKNQRVLEEWQHASAAWMLVVQLTKSRRADRQRQGSCCIACTQGHVCWTAVPHPQVYIRNACVRVLLAHLLLLQLHCKLTHERT
jgi:hypothetical protein